MPGGGVRVVGRDNRATRRAAGERGSVLIFTAVALAALVGAVALSVDIGHLTYQKRNLQAIADAAAMDARFALGSPTPCATALSLVDQSATNNGFAYNAAGNSLTFSLGTASVVGNVETFTADPTSCANGDPLAGAANAVQVQTTGNVKYFFAPGSGTPSAHATWTTGPSETGVSIGTNLVTLNTADSSLLNPLFSGLLGGNVSLTAVGYQGLASASVTLGQLEAALDVGSVSQLLTTSITYPKLLSLTAAALGQQGTSGSVALGLVDNLITDSASGSFPASFTLGQLLTVADPAQSSAADISTNVLGLLIAGAEIANQANTIDIPNIGAAVPGLISATGSVQLIQAPAVAYGPVGTSASTSQVNLTLNVTLDPTGLSSVTVTVPLVIQAAQGTATIRTISCNGMPPTFTVTTQTLALNIGTQAAPLSADVNLLGVEVPLLTAYGPISVGSDGSQTLSGNPPPAAPYPENIPGQSLTLGSGQVGSLTVDPLDAGEIALLGGSTAILETTLNQVISTVADPLLDDLGVDVGTGVVGNPPFPGTNGVACAPGLVF